MANSSMDSNSGSICGSRLFICILGLLFIFYTILLRNEPSFMAARLMQQFHLSLEDMNDLTVKYQFSLILTYLFAGFIVDYVGARTILIVATLLATTGHYLFSTATSVHQILDGRILIGYAHPFIFLGALTLGTQWLPKKHFALYSGFLFAVLLLTPQMSKPFVIYFMDHFGWRTTCHMVTVFGAIICMALLLSFRAKPFLMTSATRLLSLLTHPSLWIISIVSCLGWMLNTFLLNWGSLYLYKAHTFLPNIAVSTVSQAFLFFSLGAIAMGFIANLLQKIRLLLVLGYWVSAAAFCIVLFQTPLSIVATANLIFLSAFAASAAILCYMKAYDICTPGSAGFTFGLIAFITTGGNTLFAMLFSMIIEPIASAKPPLNPDEWTSPLMVLPIVLVIGGILTLFLRKSAAVK